MKDGFKPLSAPRPSSRPTSSPSCCPTNSRPTSSARQIRDNLTPGNVLVCSHGFNVHFGQFDVPKGVSTILVAPKGPGHLVRAEFVRGAACPA